MSLTDGSASHAPSAKRNMKAFRSFANAPPAALWFDKQFPPFVNFDQESACSRLFFISLDLLFNCFSPVPIYDACSRHFMFSDKDLAGLPLLPHYKKHHDPKHADLPPNALVTVFFTLNTYTSTHAPPIPSVKLARSNDQAPVVGSSSRRDGTYSPVKGSYVQSDGTSKFSMSQVLSPNLQFLLYHGQIPDDD